MESIHVNIELPHKPITTNMSHIEVSRGRRRMRIPTAEYNRFKLYVAQVMADRKFSELKEFIKNEDAYVSVEFTFYLPENRFWKATPKGKPFRVSKRCLDTDNAVKPTIDALADAIGFDDAIILDISARKRPSNDMMPPYMIEISLVARRFGFSQLLP